MASAHRSTAPTRGNRRLVPFLVALERLRERWHDVTPHELGTWVAFDDLPAWLRAQRRGHHLLAVLRLREAWYRYCELGFPELGAVWFKPHEIDGFNPADRSLAHLYAGRRAMARASQPPRKCGHCS